MCTPVSIPITFSCQTGSGTGVCPVTTQRTPFDSVPRCSCTAFPDCLAERSRGGPGSTGPGCGSNDSGHRRFPHSRLPGPASNACTGHAWTNPTAPVPGRIDLRAERESTHRTLVPGPCVVVRASSRSHHLPPFAFHSDQASPSDIVPARSTLALRPPPRASSARGCLE